MDRLLAEEEARDEMRFATAKRAKDNKTYAKLRKEYLSQNPKCWWCGLPATDIHHKLGRVGKLLNDVKNWVGLCRKCHDKAHKERRWAVECGLMPKPAWLLAEELGRE